MYGVWEKRKERRKGRTRKKTGKRPISRMKLKDLFGFADQEKKTPGLKYSTYLKRHIINNKIDAILKGGGVIETKLQNGKSQIIRKAFYNFVVQSVSIYRSITVKNINRIELFRNMPYRKDVNSNRMWTLN